MTTEVIERPLIAPLETWPITPTWKERVDAAEQRGAFTEQDVKDSLAYNACAVGEHYGLLGMASWDATNYMLTRTSDTAILLGGEFPFAVRQGDFAFAREVLQRIAALPKP